MQGRAGQVLGARCDFRTSRVSHPPKSVIQTVIWRLRFVTCPGKNCDSPRDVLQKLWSAGQVLARKAVIRTPKSQHPAWDQNGMSSALTKHSPSPTRPNLQTRHPYWLARFPSENGRLTLCIVWNHILSLRTMRLYHPRLIKSTAILLLATLLLISHSLQLQLSHMMKIPPLWKEVMLPKALEKSTVYGATHTLNIDGNNPSSFHHSLPILPIQLPTALNHYPPSVFCNVTTDSNFFRD